MNQRKVSAKYYAFEDMVWTTPGFAELKRVRPLAELQLLAGLVWAREGGRGKCPDVLPLARGERSYFLSGKINLLPNQRSAGILLHEIAHALGPNDKLTHGPAFRRRCINLYKEYGGWSGEV